MPFQQNLQSLQSVYEYWSFSLYIQTYWFDDSENKNPYPQLDISKNIRIFHDTMSLWVKELNVVYGSAVDNSDSDISKVPLLF